MIRLTMTDEQANIVAAACEFYTRMRLGQYQELLFRMMDGKPTDEWCRRRDQAEDLLFAARKHILPELTGRGHSYGYGRFEDADLAFDVYQVIRQQFGDERPPFSYHALPTCERFGEK